MIGVRGPLTVESVRARVETIRSRDRASDYEAAHSHEDELFRIVLRAVAEGHPHSGAIAKAALASTKLDFPAVVIL